MEKSKIKRLDREISVCEAVVSVLSKRNGEELAISGKPDLTERNQKAVDFLIRGKSTNYVMEHTLIESHHDRMKDDAQFVKLLKPLEEKMSGTLPTPGSYHLAVEFGSVKGLKKENEIRDAVEIWVRLKAPDLLVGSPSTAPHHYVSEIPEKVPFRVSLYRWPTSDGRFFIERFIPANLEEKRKARIKQALDDKCPKLHIAKNRQDNTRSILVFESNDIAISNHIAIGTAFSEKLLERVHDRPDKVCLIENGIVWFLKDDEEIFPNVNRSGPYYPNILVN